MRTWAEAQIGYVNLINSGDWDARYLREQGLVPNVSSVVRSMQGKSGAGCRNGYRVAL